MGERMIGRASSRRRAMAKEASLLVATFGGSAMAAAPANVRTRPAPFVEVAIDAPVRMPATFTYSAPPELDLRPGCLVRAPFGSRTAHGVVVAQSDTTSAGYAKPVESLAAPEPLLAPERLELAQWIADYYMSPLYDAIALMLPPDLRMRSHTYVRLVGEPADPDRLGPGARQLLAHLRSGSRRLRISRLERTLGSWTRNAIRALVESGAAVEELCSVASFPKKAMERQALTAAKPPGELRVYADAHPRAQRRVALIGELLKGKPLDASSARRQFGAVAVRALVAEGLANLVRASPPAPDAPVSPLLPTAAQQRALAAINGSLDCSAAHPREWLLHGVTGSGKTEVYLQAVAHCLETGRRAIVLVPEIALTPQMLQRFESRFPGRVAVLHSGIAAGRRAAEWRRVFNGERDVVVGPRSALFAPVGNLGLIALDEEHEGSYKQEEPSPAYHAREVARRLSALTGAVLLLGSATPDVTTAYRAKHGDIGKLELPARLEPSGAAGSLARVQIVDMREELRRGNRGIFCGLLGDALQETLAAKRQAVLFINRRGAATVVSCRSCGHAMTCPRCLVSFTHHRYATAPDDGGARRGEWLLCHYCGSRRDVPSRCPQCRSDRIRYLGLGSQRVADEVAQLAPEARVLRWDSDTAGSAGAHERLLKEFASGKANVLVGTQMVAKGLDVPTVDLVGVVLADVGLHMPDFRAAERTFQLLTQVAGRAGRGGAPGRAIVQTYIPDHYAVQTAAAQDYAAFFDKEVERRRSLGNPPFNKIARLRFGSSGRKAAAAEASRLGGLLRRVQREWDMREAEIVGPAPTYPPRQQNNWQWHIIVRAPEPRALLDKADIPSAWRVDIDPAHVL